MRRLALGKTPPTKKAQPLAVRWAEMVEISTGGDPEITLGYAKASALRQLTVSCNVESIAKFIGEAFACSIKKYHSEEGSANSLGQSNSELGRQAGIASRRTGLASTFDEPLLRIYEGQRFGR
jgi:hypothetical protein